MYVLAGLINASSAGSARNQTIRCKSYTFLVHSLAYFLTFHVSLRRTTEISKISAILKTEYVRFYKIFNNSEEEYYVNIMSLVHLCSFSAPWIILSSRFIEIFLFTRQ